MSAAVFRPRRILVVLGPGEEEGTPDPALAAGLHLADRTGAALNVIRCVPPPKDLQVISRLSGRAPDVLLEDFLHAERERVAARLAQIAPDHGLEPVVRTGKAFVEIIREGVAAGVDLVIKTAEPVTPRFQGLLSSTDQHLLRKCPCAVWLQTRQGAVTPRRVIAAVDADESDAGEPETLRALNRKVIETARGVVGEAGEVIAAHAWDAAGEGALWAFGSGADARQAADAYVNEVRQTRDAALHAMLAPFRQDAEGASVTPRLVRGAPQTALASLADSLKADAVVLGTVARTGLGGVIIGNTAENVINTLRCPVIAVKPDGFVSPLKLSGDPH